MQEGDYVQQGDLLMDGNPRAARHPARARASRRWPATSINEIQEVYRLQGVKINDKHIEVIVRQMLQKVEIVEPGETTFLVGEQIDRAEFDDENAKATRTKARAGARRSRCCRASPRPSLQTSSFISAASFQETTRVLTEAAVSGRIDSLIGLKENVIVGRLIPAGTGASSTACKEIAAERDRQLRGEPQPALPAVEEEKAPEVA